VYGPQKGSWINGLTPSALAKHYGFAAEELDFIINYDIKYRMGGKESDEA
jgi:hypothetical protein